ncbi:MAG: hypothetical protein U1F65_03270 [Verrucomicrobiota bacterium]
MRIELLNDFGKTDEFCRGPNLRYLASCFRSFSCVSATTDLPAVAPDKILIFCLAATGSNLLNLLPVAKEAQRRGLLGGIVTGEAVERTNPGAFKEFPVVVSERDLCRRVGMKFLPGSLARAIKRLNRIVRWLNVRHDHSALRVRQNFGAYLKLMVQAERSQIIWRRLLSQWKPSSILTTSDFYPFEFHLIAEAKKLGIPSAILQHGEPNDVVVWPTYADTFLAWGKSYEEQLIKRGAPEERVKITGMPSSDAWFNRAKPAGTDSKKTQGGCLVLSHTQDRIEDAELFERFGQCLKETIEKTPSVKWKIKLHPSEDDTFYRETGLSALTQVEILPRNISLEESVLGSDVVCTIRSTAGLQAMMLQKPVVVLDLARTAPVTWPLQGGGIYAKCANDFSTLVNQLVSDQAVLHSLLEQQQAFLGLKFAHRGNATAAVVDCLTIQKRKTGTHPSPLQ